MGNLTQNLKKEIKRLKKENKRLRKRVGVLEDRLILLGYKEELWQ